MEQSIVAFVTGLTTGGLSCLAVQGGLLASSLSRQIETDLLASGSAGKGGKVSGKADQGRLALSILLFLAAKLAVYTLLGFLLGALGSVLQLNATTRAILLIAIGIFMVGNALRMFDVHPIFRYFAIEPPRFVTRFIRRTAKDSTDLLTPLFLGALTVLIPCGVTQAMMAVAVGSGDPLTGAAMMFAFTLGTSPVFFAVAYFTMQLGRQLEKWFMRFVAAVVLVLGLVSIDSGLNLAGSPLSVSRLLQGAKGAQAAAPAETQPVSGDGILVLAAQNDGYAPRLLTAPADTDLVLNVVTQDTYSCSRAFVIPALGVEVLLPQTGTTPIAIPAQAAGTVMQFTCSMGMYTGEIVFGQ
jgi:sulfite exporter TauE/SafE